MAGPAPAPAPIWAVSPDGQVGLLDPAVAQEFLTDRGFRLATPAETQIGLKGMLYSGPGAKFSAFSQGALNTLTFGGSSALAQAAGQDPQYQRDLSEYQPGYETAGKVAGAVLPALLTAGGSLAPEGAALAAKTAPGLISAAGRAVESGVAGALGKGALARAGARAAMGATEGALYGAGDVAGKFFQRDPELDAQKAMAEIGFAGLLGGGVAAGLGAAGDVFAGAIRKGQDAAASLAAKVNKEADPQTLRLILSQETRPAVVEFDRLVPGVVDDLSGAKPETARFLVAQREAVASLESKHPGITRDVLIRATPEEAAKIISAQDQIITSTQARMDLGEMLTQKVTDTYKAVDDAVRQSWRTARAAEVDALAAKADPAAAASQMGEVFDQVTDLAKKMRVEKDLFNQGSARRLEMLAEGLARDATSDPAEIFRRLNTAKQELDDLIPYGAEASSNVGRWTADKVEELRGAIKRGLEDTGVWGQAGERQAAYNQAFAAYKRAEEQIAKGPSFQKLLQKVTTPEGRLTYEANPRQINMWLNAMADARGSARTTNFNAYLDSAESLANEMERSGFGGAADLRSALQKVKAEFSDTEAKAAVTQLVKQIQSKGGPLGSGAYIPTSQELASQAAQTVARTIPGVSTVQGVVEGITAPVRRPSFMVGALEAFGNLAAKAEAIIPKRVAGMFEAASGAGEAEIAGRLTSGVTSKNYQQVADSLNQHASDAQMTGERLALATGDISDHAPDHAVAMQMAAARAVAHLAAKLPKPPDAAPLDAAYRPSQAELATFNRHLDAAQRPLDVLQKVARGTVTPEHVETLKTVYPRLLAEMQAQTLDRLASEISSGKKIPYRVRLSLAAFLEQDLDSGSVGMARNQAALLAGRKAEQAEQAQQGNAAALTVATRTDPGNTRTERMS